jgi:hypothetical protein
MQNLYQFYLRILNQINQIIYQSKHKNNIKKKKSRARHRLTYYFGKHEMK